MRRVRNFLIDLLDGIVSAILYGGQGGLTYTTTKLEAQNQAKLREWAAGEADAPEQPEKTTADLDARIRAFRAKRNSLER